MLHYNYLLKRKFCSIMDRGLCVANTRAQSHYDGNVACFYRPQRSWAKVIFSQACVKNSVHRRGGGCLPQCMLGYTTPPGPGHTPPEQTPPQTRHPPGSRHSLGPGTHLPPLGADPPQTRHTPRSRHPPREADCNIRSTSGRYASYWNAFLLTIFSVPFSM